MFKCSVRKYLHIKNVTEACWFSFSELRHGYGTLAHTEMIKSNNITNMYWDYEA